MTDYHFIEHLPDLIQPEEYAGDPGGKRVRLRIRPTPDGVEILGDAIQAQELEALLESLSPEVIFQMLCG
jgi:hypothetical protein